MCEAATTGLSVSGIGRPVETDPLVAAEAAQYFRSRITSMPIYELKMAFSLHGFYCSEHVGEFAGRVREMRQPPYGLEVSPDASLDLFFDEILAAPATETLFLGLYEYAVPALIRALENMVADTNRLFDHPTYRICRLTLLEMQDVQAVREEALACLVTPSIRAQLQEWLSTLDRMLAAAGDLDGKKAATGKPWRGTFPDPLQIRSRSQA